MRVSEFFTNIGVSNALFNSNFDAEIDIVWL